MLAQSRLGNTDLYISRLGLGTVKLGRNSQVKYPQAFELPSDAQARELLHVARDLGINLLDTAASYGASEERLGELLRGARKDWIICSKAGENYNGYESQFDFSPAALRRSLERSLRHLRTDYLDILLIHSNGEDSDIIQRDQALQTLASFKREGWIRAFGMSSKTVEGGRLCSEQADLLMTTYDPEQDCDRQLLDQCAERNTGVLLKKIFNSGKLLEQTQTRSRLAVIEQQMQLIFAHKATNSAIIGTLNCQHLRDNVACALNVLSN